MKKVNKIFYKFIIPLFILFSLEANSEIISIGSPDSKITVKVFSSLISALSVF